VQAVASGGPRHSVRWLLVVTAGVFMSDNSMTGTFQVNLPKDLLSEAKRQNKPGNDRLQVEGWRTSWLSRISEILVGKD
jgi:hypothetical protein